MCVYFHQLAAAFFNRKICYGIHFSETKEEQNCHYSIRLCFSQTEMYINRFISYEKPIQRTLITSKFGAGLFLAPFLPPSAAKLMIFLRAASSKVKDVRDFFNILLKR